LIRTRKYLIALIFAILSMSVAGKTFAETEGSNHENHGSTEHPSTEHTNTEHPESSGGWDSDAGESDTGSIGSNSTISSNSSQSITQNQVRDVVQSGKAVSLPLVLAYMDNYYQGQVLDIKLRSSLFGYYYDVKYLDASNHLLTVALDAKTLTKR
jgi:hypothetical protein